MQNSFKVFFVRNGYFPAHTNNIGNHMKNISTGLGQFRATYDYIILIEDFNVEPEENNMPDSLYTYNLENPTPNPQPPCLLEPPVYSGPSSIQQRIPTFTKFFFE